MMTRGKKAKNRMIGENIIGGDYRIFNTHYILARVENYVFFY